jgi:AAA+ ATPase superfamily predicted ATPase
MNTDYRQLFPLGKAYGKAFCNRKKETADLVGNIQSGKHTLLIAPRRYGKSSLAERGIEKADYPFTKINFHLCTSEEEVTEFILNHVIKLIGESIGQVNKMMASIKKYLSNLEPLLSFGNDIAKLQLIPKRKTNPSMIISEALLLIENLLRDKKKRAILFLDEFQEINHISQHRAIEGAIRTAAQEMQKLSIIFSGSIRSLLLSMFEDENRPLYKLCRKIKLDRISIADYQNHIQKIATMTWGNPLEQDVFNKIISLSNRHPYYINYLCDVIWADCENVPNIKNIENSWNKVVIEEWSDALKELSDLPLGQKRILKYIAINAPKNLTSQEACQQLSMPASSITTALQALTAKDYIEKDVNNHYQVINPLLCTVLKGATD